VSNIVHTRPEGDLLTAPPPRFGDLGSILSFDPSSITALDPISVALLATVGVVLCVWYSTLQLARLLESPAWYERAEIVGGVVGLSTLTTWHSIAHELVFLGAVSRPLLWALKWTVTGAAVGMVLALATKIFAERQAIWTPVDGVLERRKIDIYDE